MLREQMRKDIQRAINKLSVDGSQFTVEKKDVEVVRTTNPKFGDFSTNISLRLTQGKLLKVTKSQRDKEIESKRVKESEVRGGSLSEAKDASSNEELRLREIGRNKSSLNYYQSSIEIAKVLADSLRNQPYIEKLEVKEPGFINFFIKKEYWQEQVEDILKAGKSYGSNQSARGKKARVEFVSANPTGPLHFGNARGGPIGDVLASILAANGYEVLREYYNNDLGVQVGKLGESIVNVQAGKPLLEQEYKGEYVLELSKKLGKVKDAKEAGQKAVEFLSKQVIDDCKDMGIVFNKVYSESQFLDSGKTKEAVSELTKKNSVKEKDGAVWFAPNDEFLKDRETVLVKSDGDYTYFASDIAYHRLKFSEKYDLVIDVFGANHHGHVPRLRAAISALGFDESKFYVILYQWVRFLQGQKLAKMSKRAGTLLTAKEVLKEVSKDALRFFILMYDPNSHIDFDLDLAREQSSKNPVYYVQYAHARIASILRRANPKSEIRNPKIAVNCELLTSSFELDLIKQITKLPELVEEVVCSFAVNQLTTYATGLADAFHRFYENCPVLTSETGLKEARTGLLLATQIALANTLNLLGISAPEKM